MDGFCGNIDPSHTPEHVTARRLAKLETRVRELESQLAYLRERVVAYTGVMVAASECLIAETRPDATRCARKAA